MAPWIWYKGLIWIMVETSTHGPLCQPRNLTCLSLTQTATSWWQSSCIELTHANFERLTSCPRRNERIYAGAGYKEVAQIGKSSTEIALWHDHHCYWLVPLPFQHSSACWGEAPVDCSAWTVCDSHLEFEVHRIKPGIIRHLLRRCDHSPAFDPISWLWRRLPLYDCWKTAVDDCSCLG